MKSKRLTCQEAKQLDLVNYLASLGHHPVRQCNENYWYLSPLRLEKTASFKINRAHNVWYDHGSGQGGNIIDLGVLYHNCSVKEFLQKLEGNIFSHHQPFTVGRKIEKSSIEIVSASPITSMALIRYVQYRRIAPATANKYCYEVNFCIGQKNYKAIGFRNDKGGYELRNQWFKGSCSPKTVTSIKNGSAILAVFEGFFNFLSLLSIPTLEPIQITDFLILNSAAFFNKSMPFMEEYDRVHLYLDRDQTGQNFTKQALSASNKYSDKSGLYDGYKDLNEWIMQIGNPG